MPLRLGPERLERVFWPVFWLVAVLYGLLIVATEALPGHDFLPHLTVVRSLRLALVDPQSFSESFGIRPWTPYWGYYSITALLSLVLPLELASRIVVASSSLAVPLFVAVAARRDGSSPWGAFLSFPLVLGINFYFGFAPFLVGMAVALFGLLPVSSYLGRSSRSLLLWLCLLSLVIFVFHPVAWGFWALGSSCQALSRWWYHRDEPVPGKLLLTFVAPLTLAIAYSLVAIDKGWPVSRDFFPLYGTLSYRVETFLDFFFPTSSRESEAASAVCFLLIALMGYRRGGQERTEARSRWILFAGALFAFYWVGPNYIGQLGLLFARVGPYLTAILPLGVPAEIRGMRFFAASALVYAVLSLLPHVFLFREYDREIDELGQCLRRLDRGATMLPLIERKHLLLAPHLKLYLQAGDSYVLMRDGRAVSNLMEQLATSMVFYLRREFSRPQLEAALGTWRFDHKIMGEGVRYFLTHGTRAENGTDTDRVVLGEGFFRVRLSCASGHWKVYESLPASYERRKPTMEERLQALL